MIDEPTQTSQDDVESSESSRTFLSAGSEGIDEMLPEDFQGNFTNIVHTIYRSLIDYSENGFYLEHNEILRLNFEIEGVAISVEVNQLGECLSVKEDSIPAQAITASRFARLVGNLFFGNFESVILNGNEITNDSDITKELILDEIGSIQQDLSRSFRPFFTMISSICERKFSVKGIFSKHGFLAFNDERIMEGYAFVQSAVELLANSENVDVVSYLLSHPQIARFFTAINFPSIMVHISWSSEKAILESLLGQKIQTYANMNPDGTSDNFEARINIVPPEIIYLMECFKQQLKNVYSMTPDLLEALKRS